MLKSKMNIATYSACVNVIHYSSAKRWSDLTATGSHSTPTLRALSDYANKKLPMGVFLFWPTLQGSNLSPSESESDALS